MSLIITLIIETCAEKTTFENIKSMCCLRVYTHANYLAENKLTQLALRNHESFDEWLAIRVRYTPDNDLKFFAVIMSHHLLLRDNIFFRGTGDITDTIFILYDEIIERNPELRNIMNQSLSKFNLNLLREVRSDARLRSILPRKPQF